jgi:chemotaxis protein MotB
MAGGGGGAWKVAYADFVTAMMAFFLVMWIVAQNKPVKEAVAGYFKDPYGTGSKSSGMGLLAGRDGQAPAVKTVSKDLRNPLRGPSEKEPKTTTTGDQPGVTGRKTVTIQLQDGDRSSVGTQIPFAPDSADLADAGRDRLNELVPQLLGKPNKIEIRGHAVRRPASADGAAYDVWQLCYDRCQTTLKYLVDKGVEAERIRLSQAGAFEPRAGADPQSDNSRVEVYLLGEYVKETKPTRTEKDERPATSGKPRPKGRVLRGPAAEPEAPATPE